MKTTNFPLTAFGEIQIAELTPIVQLQSSYNINTRVLETRDNNGTSSFANSMFQVSTGASANQSSMLLSRRAVKYNAGQGGLVRFTALFTTGVANSSQYIGAGSSAEGFFFGYDGATFGVLRRSGGLPEVRTLTVTTKSTTAENITITLDGDADATVTVTDASATDVTTTANEIASHDYSDLGQGWTAHAMGANVIFESYNAASQTGTYSVAGTSVVGSFAQSVVGVAPTDTHVAQADWNADKMDGTGPSKMTLDHTKGNVYHIQYQWLGFGQIQHFIEDDIDGDLHLVHTVLYANNNTVPSLNNPTLRLCLSVVNTSNTSDIVLKSSSMVGGIQGKDAEGGLFNATTLETTSIGTTETPVLSIHNHTIYQSVVNKVEARLDYLGVSFVASSAKKPALVRVTLNPTLTAASFAAINANTSVMRKDTSATAMSGGTVIFAQSMTESAALNLDFAGRNIKIEPGDTLTISLEASNGTIDPDVSLGWKELF
jgi:hypothetical protein